jgi:hypothetical protein
MSLNANQFKYAPIPGELDLTVTPEGSVFSCRYDVTDTGETLETGEGVKLVDLGADDSVGPPFVGTRDDDLDPIFGIKILSTKAGEVDPGAVTQIAKAGAVVFMTTGEALARGVQVSLVTGTPGSVQALGTKAVFGTLLDKAADGDVVRVLITADGITEGTE